jgi:hypothetical protein
VWPSTSLPSGQPLPSGILYRMGPWGGHFEVLYPFTQTNSSGENMDEAECYEPFVDTRPGVFYGTTRLGGINGNGVVFRQSLVNPGAVEVLHEFSATNKSGENWDDANPTRVSLLATTERCIRLLQAAVETTMALSIALGRTAISAFCIPSVQPTRRQVPIPMEHCLILVCFLTIAITP